jgi:hypothetical protein
MTLLRLASFPRNQSRHACAAWVLMVSVLLGFDPPQILVYVDPQDHVNGVTETVAREACPYLRAEGVPLPVNRSRSAGSAKTGRASATCRTPDVASVAFSRAVPNRRPFPVHSQWATRRQRRDL